MLLRRSALTRAGGFAAIKGALIDDCALARAIKGLVPAKDARSEPGGIWLHASAIGEIRASFALMDALGYDKDYKGTLGDDPAAVGNRIAITVLFNGFSDGANEAGNYENTSYLPINPPLLPDFTGNPDLEEKAWRMMRAFSAVTHRGAAGHCILLMALDFLLGPSREIVIAGDN